MEKETIEAMIHYIASLVIVSTLAFLVFLWFWMTLVELRVIKRLRALAKIRKRKARLA